MVKTCKKGLHQYTTERQCPVCNRIYMRELMRKRRRAAGIPESGYIYGGKKGEAQRRAWKKWHKQHPDAQKKMQKAQVEKVTPGYAARLLGGRLKDFPVDMLETKRALVLLNRKIKEMSNG